MQSTYTQIESHFRKSHGKHLSILINQCGIEHFELLENALMEAYLKALKVWPFKGMPDNPSAWIHTVSKRSFLDSLKKKSPEELTALTSATHGIEETLPEEGEIKDGELKLLFLICHPQLKPRDQLAFMLKSLSGFGIKEIAKAMMSQPEQIKKSLYRARKFVQPESLNFELTDSSAYHQRVDMVHKALYLLFNEAYYPSTSEQTIRKEMCIEAMRLCKYLCEHQVGNQDSYALMSIMCYHISRYESRIDEDNKLILLANQNREKWDSYFIELGHFFLDKSTDAEGEKSVYQIEAAICGQHCIARSIEDTNWGTLELLYNALLRIKNNDWVKLNYIVVLIMGGKLDKAKSIFEEIDEKSIKSHKEHYYHVGAELYKKLKDHYMAKMWVAKARRSLENM